MSSPHQSVPPAKSSHIPEEGKDTGGAVTEENVTHVIRVTRLAFLGVFLLLMCVFFPIVGWPAGLWWLLVLPLAVLVWVLRTQTTVSPAGLDLRTVFGSRHIDWDRVRGLRIPKRGFVRAHLDDDTEVKLPAVSYDRLRELVEASGGRIPDPFARPDVTDAPAEGAANTTESTQAAIEDTDTDKPVGSDKSVGTDKTENSDKTTTSDEATGTDKITGSDGH